MLQQSYHKRHAIFHAGGLSSGWFKWVIFMGEYFQEVVFYKGGLLQHGF